MAGLINIGFNCFLGKVKMCFIQDVMHKMWFPCKTHGSNTEAKLSNTVVKWVYSWFKCKTSMQNKAGNYYGISLQPVTKIKTSKSKF